MRGRRRDEAGVAALLFALVLPTILVGMAALAVDVGMLYREAARLQRAADAAALSGVTWMPGNLDQATVTARATAAKNGYPVGGGTSVTVAQGGTSSQLRVTISTTVDNTFGAAIGSPTAQVSRTAVADYTAPAPMGSPCNTFGNEPRGNTSAAAQPTGTALPSTTSSNCPKSATTGTSQPNFWAGIEGPQTDKLQGDRYQARKCSETSAVNGKRATGCAANLNAEYRAEGYFYAIRVDKAVVDAGATVDVQVYDPAYVKTGVYCDGLPAAADLSSNMNPFSTSDGLARYGRTPTAGSGSTAGATEFCAGDLSPGVGTSEATDTTFVLRGTTTTADPLKAPVLSGCSSHTFVGSHTAPSVNSLKDGTTAYNPELARVFHQWFSLCSFKPTQAGDYYLQVRSNVSVGGTPYSSNTNSRGSTPSRVILKQNPNAAATAASTTLGSGANAFSLRVVPSVTSLRSKVAVASWERMPLLQIVPDSTATFNLVRALPNTRGQFITFDFFDASDGGTGVVRVLPPGDATGSVRAVSGVAGCRAALNEADPSTTSPLVGCAYPVTGVKTDGQVVKMVIPIPNDYDCDDSKLTGCWFRVEMAYSGKITDFTTWSANIAGDPVRLVE